MFSTPIRKLFLIHLQDLFKFYLIKLGWIIIRIGIGMENIWHGIGSLSDRPTVRLTDKLTDKLTTKLTDKLIVELTDKLTDNLTDKLTDKLTDLNKLLTNYLTN